MLFQTRVWQAALVLFILLSSTVPYGESCTSLIASNGNVKFSASTSSKGPGFPVIQGNDVWCAGVINREQHLKVDLGKILMFDRVSVQGLRNTRRSVCQYLLETSTDNVKFNTIRKGGGSFRVFFGTCFNGDAVASSNLTSPVQARYLMFKPQEPLTQNENYLCMRIDVLSCQNAPAPVDGGLSEWSAWSPCPVACLPRIRHRSRTCSNPAPAFGGRDCSGHKAEDQFCPINCSFPVHGNWGSWGAWSPCSKTCGSGSRTRIRYCDNPSPARGGNDCVGESRETEACLDRNCTLPTTSPPSTTPQPPATNASAAGNYTGMYTSAPATTSPAPATTSPAPATTSPAPTTGSSGNQTSLPDIDVVFAISATSNISAQTFNVMQNTIKQFIDKYGANKVHYSLIVSGGSATTVINFNHTFPPSANELKTTIDAQVPLSGDPALGNALEEAFRVFNGTIGRPNAIKALVVITDQNSGDDEGSLATAVRPLEDDGVLVISVAIGAVNRSELLVISPNHLDVISVAVNVNPLALAVRIMDRILRKIPEIDVGFAISASSISSKVIYNVLLQTINTINERYAGYKVNFSVTVFGSRITTRLDLGNTAVSHEDLISAVNGLDEVSGPFNLKDALMEAERLFRSKVRPGAKPVFVVITDTGNDNDLQNAGDLLRRHGVIILSVNHTGDQMNYVTISHIDYLGTPTKTTDRPVFIAETIISKALKVNIPEIDLTFAISATSVESASTFSLMRATIISIIQQYGIDRIHYSVIVFGSVSTTTFDFSYTPPTQIDLRDEVSRLRKSDGSPDLVKALEDAKRVYELQEVRPNARRVLVVIMDNATVSSKNDLKEAVRALVNNSVFIVGVGVGPSVNPKDLDLITREVRHILIVGVNKSPNELAEEIMEIIDLGIRTAGFSLWGWWSACSKTCRSFGVAGTQSRSRVCINPKLGCDGATVETRECNTQNCQGCQERVPPSDASYQASTAITPPRRARLNASNPGASEVAWCRNPGDINGFIQIDLGEPVLVSHIATKGQQADGAQAWVTSFFVTVSSDGLSYSNYEEGGQRKEFAGNTNPTEVVLNVLNTTSSVQYVRFHPLTFEEQPCMQASVFGCTASAGPVVNELSEGNDAGIGILLALWILAGVLSFLLLMACCYYCCWHVCCGRGKKRKGLSQRYLIEDDADKRWILMPTGVPSRPVPENEIQEVVVEIGEENAKPSGVIQFGIETEESKANLVTAEAVHSELPVYSEEVASIGSNASTLTMGSSETGNRTTGTRKRTKSETAASVLGDTSSITSELSFRNQRRGSGFANGGYMRYPEWLTEPAESPKVRRSRKKKKERSKSVDELATVDYDMFEERRGSAQNAETDRDGYTRMKQTSRGSADMANGGISVESSDVAIGGIGATETPQGSQQQYGMEEQEFIFLMDNDGDNVHVLEEWVNGMGGEGVSSQSSADNEPIYSEVGAEIQGFTDGRRT